MIMSLQNKTAFHKGAMLQAIEAIRLYRSKEMYGSAYRAALTLLRHANKLRVPSIRALALGIFNRARAEYKRAERECAAW